MDKNKILRDINNLSHSYNKKEEIPWIFIQRVKINTELLLDLVEKEVPQKVIKTETSSQACPECKSDANWKYCSNCGQKLSY